MRDGNGTRRRAGSRTEDTGRLRPVILLTVLPLLLLADARRAAAQDGVELFPARSAFSPLLADPREPGFRGSFVLADRPESGGFEGRNIEAEVALGHEFGLVRFSEEDVERGVPEVTFSVEVGIFTRFFMESGQKDLINADFRVGAPLALAYRGWEARLEYQHFSSHYGDDFVARFEPPLQQASRDGFALVLARRFRPALRAYVGGRANFHANPGIEDAAARAGLEWDPGGGSGQGLGVWPFAAFDFQYADNTEEVAGTGTAGALLRLPGQTLRLELRGHFGPSPMGQLAFVQNDESFVGLGLRFEL